MSTKHTPGPWKYQKPRGHQHAIDRKYEVVAPINGGGESVIVGEHTGVDCLNEANARLIAAAPDLLAALQAIEDSLQTSDGAFDWINSKETVAAFADARAAIAKAKA
mgnify:FL=1